MRSLARDSKHGMEHHPIRSSPSGDVVPQALRLWLQAFRPHVTGPTWQNLLVLVMGALLAPGKRTVSACLRMTGRADATNFTVYHQVLNRGRWKGRALARTLLDLVVAALAPEGPLIIGVDDTIERRWGARISARGIYRDPVRSSHGHFVKTSGLRWLSFMVLAPVPWAARVKALPVLTLLAPSERADAKAGRRHKLLTDWARQGMLQLCRWLPGRRIVFVGDASFAVHTLAHALAGHATLISHLRLDASLYAPPAERHTRTQGRPAQKGPPLPKLSAVLADPATCWQRITAPIWYGKQIEKPLEIASGTALWYRRGTPPRPIRLGCWSAIPQASECPKPSSAPTPRLPRPRSSRSSCAAGRSRSHSRRSGPISVSRPSANGRTRPSAAPRPRSWASTA